MTSLNSPNSLALARKRLQKLRSKWIAIVLLVLIAILGAIQFPVFHKKAELGSAYAAQLGCSCHFIGGRSIGSCEGDLESAAWMVSMTADDSDGTVTGSVPVLASRKAKIDPLMGCQLLPE